MTNGTSQGLFIVVAIVIFGIFVLLSQTLFGDQLSNGLVGLFDDSIEQVEFRGSLSRNFVLDGDFSGYQEANFSWDSDLNGNLRASEYWYMGYNGNVENPHAGYHTHINIDKFNKPVMSFINKNNEVSGVISNRWLGTRYMFETDSPIYDIMDVGSEIVVSFDLWAENTDGYIRVGLFQPNDSGSTVQVSGTDRVRVYSEKEKDWHRVSATIEIPDSFHFDRSFRIYFYGHHDDNVEKYMDNVEVRIRR